MTNIAGKIGSQQSSVAMRSCAIGWFVMLIAAFFSATDGLAEEARLSKGQTVYLPVYSHVHVGDRALPFNLAATVVVRNTSRVHSIAVLSADYHDSDGKMLRRYVEDPVEVAPLASLDFFVKESDVSGGVAPAFVVQWRSRDRVTAPVIEAVMIGAARQQGISILSTGRVLSESPE